MKKKSHELKEQRQPQSTQFAQAKRRISKLVCVNLRFLSPLPLVSASSASLR